MNPPLRSLRVQDKITGTTSTVEGVLAYFLTQILPNIGGEQRRESLIELHPLISGNAAYVVMNLGGGRNGHLPVIVTEEDYMAQTG